MNYKKHAMNFILRKNLKSPPLEGDKGGGLNCILDYLFWLLLSWGFDSKFAGVPL